MPLRAFPCGSRTATAQVPTPRIITPSRTAWPPIGASFVAPHDEHVPALIDDLSAFAADTSVPPLVSVAVAHAQFETIHPFSDGNGRTGRALSQLPNDKPIVLHCKTGVRSAEALAAVKAAGFKDAVHVQGGVTAWATRIDKALPTY